MMKSGDRADVHPASMTPEAIAKRAERAAKLQAAIKSGHVDSPEIASLDPSLEQVYLEKTNQTHARLSRRYKRPINSLRRIGTVAIALKPESDEVDVKRGISLSSKVTGGVLWLPADRYVQGEHDDSIDPSVFSRQVVDLRKEGGFGVIGFTGVNFGPNPGRGTEGILSRVIKLIYDQRDIAQDISPLNRPSLGIIGVGEPSVEQLDALNNGVRLSEELYFPDFLRSRYVLKRDGSLEIARVGAIDLPPRSSAEGEIVPQPGLLDDYKVEPGTVNAQVEFGGARCVGGGEMP